MEPPRFISILATLFASRPTPWNSPFDSRPPPAAHVEPWNACGLLVAYWLSRLPSGAITHARAGYVPIPETLQVFRRVDDLIDERRGTAHRGEYPGVLQRVRIGLAVEQMSIDIDHHIVRSWLPTRRRCSGDLATARTISRTVAPLLK